MQTSIRQYDMGEFARMKIPAHEDYLFSYVGDDQGERKEGQGKSEACTRRLWGQQVGR